MSEISNEFDVCPVCGKTKLGYFEVCDVCEWQNDRYQAEHPDVGGCANNMSLNQARKHIEKAKKYTNSFIKESLSGGSFYICL